MQLNPASPDYGDIYLKNGDLAVTGDVDPTGPNPVLQDVLQRIFTFQGEWFLDNRVGVPYFQEIFRKKPTLAQIEVAFSSEILATPGVLGLVRFAAIPNYAARLLSITFTLRTQMGTVTYTGTVNGSGL